MSINKNLVFERILLLEDDSSHAMLIKRALEDFSDSVHVLGTLRDALSSLETHQFDIVISDLNLPDASRDDTVTALRNYSAELPLLVLTSSSLVSDGVAAMRGGADDFLVKNFDSTFRDVLQVVLSRLKNTVDARAERRELERDRAVLREAIENSNDGLAVVFRDGTIGHRNAAFEDFLASMGMDATSLKGLDSDGVSLAAKLARRLAVLSPGAVWRTECGSTSTKERAFELSIAMSMQPTSPDSAVVWVRDVSEKKQRERFQRELLSTTTHDLKGPLGSISLSCEVLQRKGAEEPLVDGIASSARAALQLIDEFLSARSIEDGAYVLRPVSQPFLPVLLRVAENLRISAERRNINIKVAEDSADIVGCIDTLGCERVLMNLVSNAIKFSPQGSIVSVACRRADEGVVCSVKDEGRGIEASDIHRLFERYGRLEEHGHISGTGLGLFIVKCIVNAHNGTIDVTSEQGSGTVFEIFFPDDPPRNERGEIICQDVM